MPRTAIISVDGHVKAPRAGYREFVEQQYLEDFDLWLKAADDAGLPDARNLNPAFGVEAQWDSDRRLQALESAVDHRRHPVGLGLGSSNLLASAATGWASPER